ncbi:MAG: hypothetical protein Q8942_09750 [Bacillota bacterium]|nr:hypothetical protein [Bacillota bacterium]
MLIIFVARFKPLWNIILFAVKMILYAVYSFYSHLFIGSGGSSKVENNDIRLFPKPEYNISYLETLGKLVNIIIIALFSVLTLYLIFKLTMAILKWFYSKSEARKSQDSKLGYTDEKEVILKSHSGFLANMKKRLSNFDYKEVHLNDLKTSRDKVRFIYRQKIMSFIKKGYVFKGYLSPNEHANELNAKYDENISDLTSLYNKARYSNDDIEDKDIEALNLNKTRQNI